MAVGGVAEAGGVLTTANYVARKYGVRSAMATFVAMKLCPSLVLLPVSHEKYSRFSGIVKKVFEEYDKNVRILYFFPISSLTFFATLIIIYIVFIGWVG